MPLPIPAVRPEERVIAGVCAGIAQALAVDVTLVRLVFALLALAGGAGILIYLALWARSRNQSTWWTALLVLVAGSLLLHSVGLSDRAVIGTALVALGLAIVWREAAAASVPMPRSRTEDSRSRAPARCCCCRAAARARRCWPRARSPARCC